MIRYPDNRSKNGDTPELDSPLRVYLSLILHQKTASSNYYLITKVTIDNHIGWVHQSLDTQFIKLGTLMYANELWGLLEHHNVRFNIQALFLIRSMVTAWL